MRGEQKPHSCQLVYRNEPNFHVVSNVTRPFRGLKAAEWMTHYWEGKFSTHATKTRLKTRCSSFSIMQLVTGIVKEGTQ